MTSARGRRQVRWKKTRSGAQLRARMNIELGLAYTAAKHRSSLYTAFAGPQRGARRQSRSLVPKDQGRSHRSKVWEPKLWDLKGMDSIETECSRIVPLPSRIGVLESRKLPESSNTTCANVIHCFAFHICGKLGDLWVNGSPTQKLGNHPPVIMVIAPVINILLIN